MAAAAGMQRVSAPARRHGGVSRRSRGVHAAAQPPERPPAAPAPLTGLLGATRGSLLEAVLEQARELLASPQRATTHAPLWRFPPA
jgi:hypothetical protein